MAAALLASVAAVAVPAEARPSPGPDREIRSVRVLSYNVCGASKCQYTGDVTSWLDEMATQVDAWDADVLMLQEVCFGQWDLMRDRFEGAGYIGLWSSTTDAGRCAKWGPELRFGNAMFVRGEPSERFTAHIDVPDGEEPRGVLCARSPLDGRPTLICNTHLAKYIPGDNGMGQVLDHVDRWAAGLPVVLGGDFNARLDEPALQAARTGRPGTGPLAGHAESLADGCEAVGGVGCAGGRKSGANERKIDHILVTTRDFHTGVAAVSEPGLSDHQLLFAAAYPK